MSSLIGVACPLAIGTTRTCAIKMKITGSHLRNFFVFVQRFCKKHFHPFIMAKSETSSYFYSNKIYDINVNAIENIIVKPNIFVASI